MTSKTIEAYFRDWEATAFGFGYGSGEEHIIPALAKFLHAIPAEGNYDHEALAAAVGPVVAWSFVNVLCHQNAIEYGTSPRYGWLTQRGKNLKAFFDARTTDELLEAMIEPENSFPCYPTHCNCGSETKCVNPFWNDIKVAL